MQKLIVNCTQYSMYVCMPRLPIYVFNVILCIELRYLTNYTKFSVDHTLGLIRKENKI